MNIRIFVLALALTAIAARADVVVYKGSGTCATPNVRSQYSKTPRLYYVVDLATRESFQIFYFTLNGQKKQSISFPLSPTRYASGPGNGGKTFGCFSFLFDDGGTSNFSVLSLYFRGNEKTVPLSSAKTGNFPKTMTGIFRGVSRSGASAFIDEINIVLTYDAFHTQNANNVAKSGQDTYIDLKAELSTRGF